MLKKPERTQSEKYLNTRQQHSGPKQKSSCLNEWAAHACQIIQVWFRRRPITRSTLPLWSKMLHKITKPHWALHVCSNFGSFDHCARIPPRKMPIVEPVRPLINSFSCQLFFCMVLLSWPLAAKYLKLLTWFLFTRATLEHFTFSQLVMHLL